MFKNNMSKSGLFSPQNQILFFRPTFNQMKSRSKLTYLEARRILKKNII